MKKIPKKVADEWDKGWKESTETSLGWLRSAKPPQLGEVSVCDEIKKR